LSGFTTAFRFFFSASLIFSVVSRELHVAEDRPRANMTIHGERFRSQNQLAKERGVRAIGDQPGFDGAASFQTFNVRLL